MAMLVLAALVLLGVLPFGAALAGLETALVDTLASGRILGLLGNTVLLGLVVSVVCAAVGIPVGYGLVHRRGRAASLMAGLLPLPLILPPWLMGVAWTRLLPLSGFWGAVALLSVSLWPLVALFALRGFRAAASSGDAAWLARGRRAALLGVELPLAAPSILSGTLLVFIFACTDFAVVDLLSFTDPEPFVVLSSEIFQQWAKLGSTAGAAAVSMPNILVALAALALLLFFERRHAGTFAGASPGPRAVRRASAAGMLGLGVVALAMLAPVAVLAEWAARNLDPWADVTAAAPGVMRSVSAGLATGLAVAILGVATARWSLRLGPRGAFGVLALALVPLAAPGVMLAVGEIRLWNHPANPLAAAVYTDPALLILTTTGRFLPLGVLAARALLIRQDPGPARAALLTNRSPWMRFLRVELPLLGPAMGLAFALGYLLTLRELDAVTLIPAGGETLSNRIFQMVHIASDDVTAVLCLLLVLLVAVPMLAARLVGVPGVDCGPEATRP